MKNFQTPAGPGQWRQSSGQVVDISSMSQEHIKNAIAVCFKHRCYGKIREFQAELTSREDPPYDQGDW